MEGAIKKGQPRENGNIGYTRWRKTKQNQSRETDNIGYTGRRKTKQNKSRETDNIEYSPFDQPKTGLKN